MADLMKLEEKIIFSLRELYQSYGYQQFKMSKFEPYDFYMQNKEFLVSQSVITFTDTDGTLMALKPDVTLSIVKNYRQTALGVQKVCYSENIYRVAGAGKTYREIMQTGLECLGEIGRYELSEVLYLAVESLRRISDHFVMDLSHLNVLNDLLAKAVLSEEQTVKVLNCMERKNESALQRLTDIPCDVLEKLQQLMQLNGPITEITKRLPAFVAPEIAAQLKLLCEFFEAIGCADHIFLDFSIVPNRDYYNGVVFRGYVEGIPTEVLAGGQYDQLMEKMGKQAGGVGFAVYLDQLERLSRRKSDPGADVILLYDADCTLSEIHKAKESLKNLRVLVLNQVPQDTRNCRIMKLKNGRVVEVEKNG